MRTSNKNLMKAAFLTAFFGSIVACSHGPTVQDYPDTANASDEAKNLEADINSAKTAQVDVLAPHAFKSAQESLADAKEGLSKQRSQKDSLHAVAEGRAYLDQANSFAKIAHDNMEDVVTARQQAIAAGAPAYLPEQFRDADSELRDVTSDVEKNDLNGVNKQRSKIQAAYLDLELKSIKHNNLSKAEETIQQAKKEGAEHLAPRTLALAEKSVKDTDAYINANRHDTLQLKARSAETVANADHALKITRAAKAGNKTTAEDQALQMETQQNKTLEKQAELSQTEAAAAALSAENQNLTAEQALNKKYEEAQKQFTHNEAEVYKQGDKLLIRLKGLEFPNAQAMLKGENFPLLAKVETVIRGFGKSAVTVEGHTDSRGSKKVNAKLSEERADAVKQYLVSNAGKADMSVTSKGYGDQRPLASNKTAAGRAQNRRVDVIIQPDKSSDTL